MCRVKCPGATCQFVRHSKNKDFSWLQLVNVFVLRVPVLLLGVGVQGVRGKMPRRHVPVFALLQEQGLLLAPAGESVRSNCSCLTPRCQNSRGAGSNALLKNKDFSLLQLVNVFGLMVPMLLLGVRVQGVRGQMPRCHLPVCALRQEQETSPGSSL